MAGTTIIALPGYTPVYYGEAHSVTINITKTSSVNNPTYSALTAGTSTTCSIESSTPTSVTFNTLAATNSTNTCKILIDQKGDGVTPDATLTIPITINKANQTITPQLPTDLVAGTSGPFYFDTTGSSNPVTLTQNGNCPVDTATSPWTITAKIATPCTFYLNKKGDANYNDLTSFAVTLTAGKGESTFAFNNLPTPLQLQYKKPYQITVVKTGSVQATSVGTTTGTICTAAPTVVNPTTTKLVITGNAIGTCTAQATVNFDNNYKAGSGSINIQIIPADQQLTLTRAKNGALNVTDTDTITVTTDHITNGSDVAPAVSLVPEDSNICAVAQTGGPTPAGTSQYTLTAKRGGTCKLNASQAGNTLYNQGLGSLSFTVNKLSQPITASLKATVTGNTVTSLEINQTGDVIVGGAKTAAQAEPVSRTQTVCKVVGVRVAIYEAGTCTLDVTQPGDGIYSDGVTTLTIQALRVPQVITVNVVQPTLHVKETKTLAVTSSNTSTPITLTPVSGPCTTFGLEVTGTGYGSCVVRASQSGSTYFVDAVPVEFSVFINKGTQTITLNPIATMQVGDTKTVTATSTTTNPIRFSSLTLDTCEIILPNTVKANKIGTCTIGAQQDETTDFLQGLAETAVSIRGVQTISFSQPAPIAINAGPATLSASASSGLTVSLISSTPAYCTVAGNVATLYKVGTCSITASQDGNGSYLAATPVTQSLTILPPASTTALASSANPVKVRKPVTLTATVSNVLATGSVSFLADGAPISGCNAVALVGGSATCTTSKLKAGTRQIVASYSGDASNQSSQSTALPQVVRSLDWLVPVLEPLLN